MENDVETALNLEKVNSVDGLNTNHEGPGLNGKRGKQVANQIRGTAGKNDTRYWQGRIFKPVNDRGEVSPHYSMRVAFKGKRMSFGLGTANKEAAARKAASIYGDLISIGIEATLAKHRAKKREADPVGIAGVGEWIEAARKVSEVNPATFNCYAASLRQIAGEILRVRKTKARFGPKKGGAKDYREKINLASLEILTPEALQKWRLEYVNRAKTPAQERSRMTTANSLIRQAKSLFSEKITRFVPALRLPDPLPFHGVQFFPRQSSLYFSRIDPRLLLRAANRELAESEPAQFLAMLLALSAGLRKGEIDSLCWHQVDFERQLIRVESTDTARLKSVDSRAEVPIDEHVSSILRGFKAKAQGKFIIEVKKEASGPRKWGRQYRAEGIFVGLNVWLRSHGVEARKPLHELRKELGALVTEEHGIYAASRVMRHSDVATTARHYTDLKSRPVVDIGAWITPENVIKISPTEKLSVKSKAR